MTKRELIQFMDELVELASEENKSKAVLIKEKFISDFERNYEYEQEVETEITELPPCHIAAMPDSMQEEIKVKVIAALTELGRTTIFLRKFPITSELRKRKLRRLWTMCVRMTSAYIMWQ